MRRLTRGRVALVCALVVLAGQLAVVSPVQAAASGDLSTTAGAVASGPATSLGIAAQGLALKGSILYVADIMAHAVRRIDLTTGNATVFAGMGAANNSGDTGAATAAGLNNPVDVDIDAAGDVYIAAQDNGRIRKVALATGIITTAYGTGASAVLSKPQGVAFDAANNMFIADTYNSRVLKITPGGVVSSFATGLDRPVNIAFLSTGQVLVSDCQDHVVLRYEADGTGKAVVAGLGTGNSGAATDGVAATASGLDCPRGMVVDATDNIFVADNGHHRVRRFTVGGLITTVAGNGSAGMSGDGAAATSATVESPTDVVRDPATGTMYVSQGADATHMTWGVRRFTVGGTIATVAGNRWPTYSGDGGAVTNAQIYRPGGVAFDSTSAMYIADSGNHRIRKSVGGVISTIAGDGTVGTGAAGDGGAATAGNLSNPQDVVVAGNGDVYISDTGHHRIRKVAAGVITNVAGTGTPGYSTGTAATSQLSSPYGIDVAANGDVYVADTGNNRIRLISGTTITTIAGTGTASYTGDGLAATTATLNAPRDVRVTPEGDVFVADTGNHVVRRIRGGVITTVAGTGAAGTSTVSGDGGLATAAALDVPAGLEWDASGNLYIADGNLNTNATSSQVVRRVDRHGIIQTIAGRTGSYSYAGDGGSGTANAARLHTPARLAFDASGNLHIAVSGEIRIRALTTQNAAAYFWTSNATTGSTGVVYGWEFVSLTATPIASITLSVPSAASGTTGLYLVDAVNLPVTGTLALSSGVLTYTLAAPVTVPAGRRMYLSVAGFTNQASSNWYTSTITTLASGGAAIDASQSGAVYFTNATPAFVLPNPDASVTASAETVIYVDPLNRSDSTVVLSATVRSNATNGYSLRMAGTSVSGVYGSLTPVSSNLAGQVSGASFGLNRFGYNVAVTGAGASTGAVGAYAGYVSGGEVAATASRPTSVNGDIVQVTNRIKVDYLQKAGVYTGTVTFQLTPVY